MALPGTTTTTTSPTPGGPGGAAKGAFGIRPRTHHPAQHSPRTDETLDATSQRSPSNSTITVEPAWLNEVAATLSKHVSVRYLGATLAKMAGVVGWSSSVELLSLKRGFVETPWWRDQLAEHHADTAVPFGRGAVVSDG
jgi:hypothetical protein